MRGSGMLIQKKRSGVVAPRQTRSPDGMSEDRPADEDATTIQRQWPPPRVKRWAPRNQTGCVTCRIRRVKCDEEKPECRRCVSSGRKCDGYDAIAQLKLRDFRLQKQPSARPKFCSSKEFEHFHFYTTVTGLTLNAGSPVDFWTRCVPLAAQTSPPVWHAAAALGAAHKKFIINNLTDGSLAKEEETTALHQLNKAVKSLLSLSCTGWSDRTTVLVVCLLLVTLYRLEGKYDNAFSHVKNGIKLCREWDAWQADVQNTETPVSTEELTHMFTYLDTQVLFLLNNGPKIPWVSAPVQLFERDTTLTSFSHAYIHLENLFNGYLQVFLDVSTTDPDQAIVLDPFCRNRSLWLRLFQLWDVQFASLLASTPSGASDRAVLTLQLRRKFAELLLSWDATRGEVGWDQSVSLFIGVVDLCEKSIERSRQASSYEGIFSFAVGVMEPLHFVAVKCRNHHIRCRALHLLESSERGEAVGESPVSASLSRPVIELEEAHWSPQDHVGLSCSCLRGVMVCNKHRVKHIRVEILNENQMALTMKTCGNFAAGEEGTRVTVDLDIPHVKLPVYKPSLLSSQM